MMHLVRTVLHKIAAQCERWQYNAQRRATDAKLAGLEALIADLKRSREAVERERSETRRSAVDGYQLSRSYTHPAKWRDTRR
jgi:hypothetical protein